MIHITVKRRLVGGGKYVTLDGKPCCLIGHVIKELGGSTIPLQLNLDEDNLPKPLHFLLSTPKERRDGAPVYTKAWFEITGFADQRQLNWAARVFRKHGIDITFS
jgi:hypothetical protein